MKSTRSCRLTGHEVYNEHMNRERFIKLPVTLVEIVNFDGRNYLDQRTRMFRYFFVDEEGTRYLWNTQVRIPHRRFQKCLLSATPLEKTPNCHYPTVSVTRGKVYDAPAES